MIKEGINARVQAVMEHGQFILGPEVMEVEAKLANYVGVKHCVTVSSGTDSLLISLWLLVWALERGNHRPIHGFPRPSHCLTWSKTRVC